MKTAIFLSYIMGLFCTLNSHQKIKSLTLLSPPALYKTIQITDYSQNIKAIMLWHMQWRPSAFLFEKKYSQVRNGYILISKAHMSRLFTWEVSQAFLPKVWLEHEYLSLS